MGKVRLVKGKDEKEGVDEKGEKVMSMQQSQTYCLCNASSTDKEEHVKQSSAEGPARSYLGLCQCLLLEFARRPPDSTLSIWSTNLGSSNALRSASKPSSNSTIFGSHLCIKMISSLSSPMVGQSSILKVFNRTLKTCPFTWMVPVFRANASLEATITSKPSPLFASKPHFFMYSCAIIIVPTRSKSESPMEIMFFQLWPSYWE
mmetsp:Transcript_57458/g.122238  ORF Transcript_57458/g.122238 Transcript_57458/m.122238 type:complete len:204 (+) Transcript_57458:330-941(+)